MDLTKFGILLAPNVSISKCVRLAKIGEEYGIDYVWVMDENPSPPFRDVFVVMTAIAQETDKIKIGTGVTNPYTRHPAVLATAFLTLDEISKGRIAIGIGAGGSMALAPIGKKMWEKPCAAIKESVETMHHLFAGETLDYSGEVIELRKLNLFAKPKAKIPIYMAARGPRMLQLVGEVADGAILTSPIPQISEDLETIRKGVRTAGRDMKAIDVANALPLSVSKSEKAARRAVKAICAFMVSSFPTEKLESVGIDKKSQKLVKEALKKGQQSAARLVTKELIETLSVAGTAQMCLEKYEKMINLGVSQIIFCSPFGPDPEKALEIIGEEIIPNLK